MQDRAAVCIAAMGCLEVGEAVVSWIGQGEAVVDRMGPGRPGGWMELGELVAGRVLQHAILQVVLHSTTMTAGVPLVRWQAVGLVRRLVPQRTINAPVVGVERRRGIE